MSANSFAAIRPHVVAANHAAEFIHHCLYVIFFRYNSTVLFIYNLSNIIFYIYALFLQKYN